MIEHSNKSVLADSGALKLILGGRRNYSAWFQIINYSHYYLEIVTTGTHPIMWRAKRGSYIIMPGGCQVIYGKNRKEFFFQMAIGSASAYIFMVASFRIIDIIIRRRLNSF